MLTEETFVDKIEILPQLGIIQVRRVTAIKRDGEEISRTAHRHCLDPGMDEARVGEQDPTVQALCEMLWTPELIAERKAYLADVTSPVTRRGRR